MIKFCEQIVFQKFDENKRFTSFCFGLLCNFVEVFVLILELIGNKLIRCSPHLHYFHCYITTQFLLNCHPLFSNNLHSDVGSCT